jgi:aerobic-type carbon monoxide dehydrogenase small subunit (CoxS/CutS family)
VIHQRLINLTPMSFDVPDKMPLLGALRNLAGLGCAKFGCGIGPVHVDSRAARSRVTLISAAVYGRPKRYRLFICGLRKSSAFATIRKSP